MTSLTTIRDLSEEEIDRILADANQNTDTELQEKWLDLTRDICCDHWYCNAIGVKDYSNLPKSDIKRIKLAAFYLARN